MTKLALVLLLVSAQVMADDEAARGLSSIQARKNFPGGQDESDLTVQPQKHITRKGEEIDVEHYESGAGEYDSTPEVDLID